MTINSRLPAALLISSFLALSQCSPIRPHPHQLSNRTPHLHKRYYAISQSTIIPIGAVVALIVVAIILYSCFSGTNNSNTGTTSRTPTSPSTNPSLQIHMTGCPLNPATVNKWTLHGGIGEPRRVCTCNTASASASAPRSGYARPTYPENEIHLDTSPHMDTSTGTWSNEQQSVGAIGVAPPPYSPPIGPLKEPLAAVVATQRSGSGTGRENVTVWRAEDGVGNANAPEVKRGRGWSRWAA